MRKKNFTNIRLFKNIYDKLNFTNNIKSQIEKVMKRTHASRSYIKFIRKEFVDKREWTYKPNDGIIGNLCSFAAKRSLFFEYFCDYHIMLGKGLIWTSQLRTSWHSYRINTVLMKFNTRVEVSLLLFDY